MPSSIPVLFASGEPDQDHQSFDRPVILVDDLVHKADRLQALAPSLKKAGIPVKKVVVGVISGYGRDLMETFHLPVESIYSMPNLRQCSWNPPCIPLSAAIPCAGGI